MPLNSSGPISLGGATTGQSINLELGQSATQQVSLNDTNVRSLAGISVGAITMPIDFWGKSAATNKAYFFFNNNTYPTTSAWTNRVIISSGNDVLLFQTVLATTNPYSGLNAQNTTFIFFKFNTQSETVVAQNALNCSTTSGGNITTARLYPANNYFWTYGSARNSTNSGTCNTRSRWNWTTLSFETGQIWSASTAFAASNDAGFFNADESGACISEMGNDIGWIITFNSSGARTGGAQLYGSSNATAFSGRRCIRAADGSIYVLGYGGTSVNRLTRHNGSAVGTVLNSLLYLNTFGDMALSSLVSTTPSVYVLQNSSTVNVARIMLLNNTLTSVLWGYDINATSLSTDGTFHAQTMYTDSNGNAYVTINKSSTTTPDVTGTYIFKINTSGTVLWQKLVRVNNVAPFATTPLSPGFQMISEDEKQLYLISANCLLNLDANGNIPAGTFTTNVLGNTVSVTITNVNLTFTTNTTLGSTTSINGAALPAISTLANATWTTRSGLNVGDSALNIG